MINQLKYHHLDTSYVAEIKKALLIFTALTILLTGGFAILLFKLEMDQFSPFLMLVPLLTSVFTQKIMLKRPILGPNGFGFRLGKKRFLIVGPLFSFIFVVIVFSISYLLHPNLFSVEQARLTIQNMSIFNENVSLGINILIAGLIQLLLAPVLNMLIFIGEEVGWRAFLYPNLILLYGKKGMIYGGLIWGIWHTPMIYFYDLNFGPHHHLGFVFMTIFCVLTGIILQYMYYKSGSILTVSLMHGMLNITGTFIFAFIVINEYQYFIDGPTGIIGLTILFMIAVFCYKRFPVHAFA